MGEVLASCAAGAKPVTSVEMTNPAVKDANLMFRSFVVSFDFSISLFLLEETYSCSALRSRIILVCDFSDFD